jgi:signal transduction histidine kinase
VEGEITVRGDRALLLSLLTNLLGNALKYAKEEEPLRVEVGTFANDGEEGVFIRDNGIGFQQRKAERLFQAFQRVDDSGPGSGIGLATAMRIVRRHGGRLWAESSPGEGATFFFTLETTTREDA